MNREMAKVLGARLTKAAEEISREFGLSVKYRGGKFDGTHFAAKVEFHILTENGSLSKDQNDFRLTAKSYNLAPDDFGRMFKLTNGSRYQIAGVSCRSYKYPIIGTDSYGKRFKFRAEDVKAGLIA
jgi:hypothetical protein